ncbi:hypothetical protein [Thiocystis violacea]|uniref:hypothetical protein n=1 Tax=Thiocystis violacea TaxID=13725 RepID=UPI001905444E|nr:hypothetical protein [Thiocystis violacea]MBK1720875.1 hypothetical protein [Thiocystis violacea]
MKELWIHAGMPKSGSSALQVFFARNRTLLLSEGVDYLELSDLSRAEKGGITSGNAGSLSRSMLRESDEGYLQDNGASYGLLIERIQASGSAKCLVSSEFFSFVGEDAYRELLDDLANIECRCKFIYYVRRQDQALISGYMQRVKRHRFKGYPEDFVKGAYRNNRLLNYYDMARRFEGVFGEGNVIAGVYESTRKHPRGLAGDFLERMFGVCPQWLRPQPSVNTSPSPAELKLLLLANQYTPRMRFSDILLNNSALTGRSEEYATHDILAPELVKEILAYFSEQNALFATCYANGEAFPAYEEAGYVDLRHLSFDANDLVSIITGFLVHFDRRLGQLEDRVSKLS